MFVYFKEADRWEGKKWTEKKGHLIVLIWGITLLAMHIIQFMPWWDFQVSGRFVETCVYVAVVFILGDVSKRIYKKQNTAA